MEYIHLLPLAKEGIKKGLDRIIKNNPQYDVSRWVVDDDGEDIVIYITMDGNKQAFIVHPLDVISEYTLTQVISYITDNCAAILGILLASMKVGTHEKI